MYRFISDIKKQIVWDKERNKELCVFQDGIYETANKRQIAILESLGFKFEIVKEIEFRKGEKEAILSRYNKEKENTELAVLLRPVLNKLKVDELRQMMRGFGLRYVQGMARADMMKSLITKIKKINRRR